MMQYVLYLAELPHNLSRDLEDIAKRPRNMEFARRRRLQAAQHAQQRGLAAAVWAGQDVERPPGHVQARAIEHLKDPLDVSLDVRPPL